MRLHTKLLTEGDSELVDVVKQLDEWHAAAREVEDEKGGRVRVRVNTAKGYQEAFIGGKWVELTARGAETKQPGRAVPPGYREAVPQNWVDWSNVMNRPATFPPSAHGHDNVYLKLDGSNADQDVDLGAYSLTANGLSSANWVVAGTGVISAAVGPLNLTVGSADESVNVTAGATLGDITLTAPAGRVNTDCDLVVGNDLKVEGEVGFYNTAPVAKTAVADPAATGNTDGEIAALTFTATPTGAECEALRDKCEELADDVRAIHSKLGQLIDALQAVGLV